MRNATTLKPPSFASMVQQFFTEYLVAQRGVSPRTVACYRDALMLFLDFASRKLCKAPTSLRLVDIQPDLVLAFLDHLEHGRNNAVRSRNLRLTALRAFLKFAGRRDVTSLHVVERGAGRADEALRAANARLSHPRGNARGAGATGVKLVLAA